MDQDQVTWEGAHGTRRWDGYARFNTERGAHGNLVGATPTASFGDSGCSLRTEMGGKSKANLKRNEAAEDTWKE